MAGSTSSAGQPEGGQPDEPSGGAGSNGAGSSNGGGAGVSSEPDAGVPAEDEAASSTGCGIFAEIEPGTPILQTISVSGVEAMFQEREFYVRLPLTYDPLRAYPLILLGHGCGGTGTSVIPIFQESGEDAIVVGLSSTPDNNHCFATSGGTASPEIAFFDALLADLSARYCVDTGKVFVAGFSSGAWLSNLLGCARGDKIRGIGTMAGGLSDAIQGQCVGHVAAMMMADTEDSSNPIISPDAVTGVDEGSGAAHTLTADRNGCSTEMTPWDAEFPECQQNTGCDPAYPVVWCVTSGKGHSDQIPMSTVGLWRFWSSLPEP
jgi:polyhydroxybutyrate depolymerase